MTVRVLLPLLLLGLITVCAVLVPVGQSIATARTQQLVIQRAGSIAEIAQHTRTVMAGGDPVVLESYLARFHSVYQESVVVVDESGEVIASIGGLPLDDEVDALILAAARTTPQRALPTVGPWSPTTALLAEPVSLGGNSAAGSVVLAVNLTAARADVTRWWFLIATIGVLLLSALLAASLYWTRWVLRPVSALDAAAHALAEHRDRAPVDVTGPPELRRLTQTFLTMAQGMEEALAQQQGLIADASHQLRNPLAAIRLRVDALTPDPDDRAALDSVDRDLDRLENIVARMLALADAEHRATARASGLDEGPGESDVQCVTSASRLAHPHRPALEAAGIRLVSEPGDDHRVPCVAGDLEEMVEILLDNVRKYAGAGAVAVLSLTSDAENTVLDVSDSGHGLSDADLPFVGTRFWRSPAHSSEPGTGLGTAIVVQLARANNASVVVDRSPQGGLRTRVTWRRT